MAVTPIKARCRRCDRLMFLREVAVNKTGQCPQCGFAISPDWTHDLREQSAIAEQSQRQLVASLSRLRRLPGNLELIPSSVLDNIIGEVGWERAMVDNPDLMATEIDNLERWTRHWKRRLPKAPPRRRWGRRPLPNRAKPAKEDSNKHVVFPDRGLSRV